MLAQASVRANGGGLSLIDSPSVYVALTMFDYWYPELKDRTSDYILDPAMRRRIFNLGDDLQAPIRLIGTGPRTMIDMRTQPEPVR